MVKSMEATDKMSLVERAFRQLQAEGKVRTQGDFAKLLGVSQNTISAAKNGDQRYLTPSLISKIDYLLEHPWNDQPATNTLPVIPTEAMAGTLGEFADSVHLYDCERMISPIKGADYAIKVCGDSMTPEIPNGSQILIKKIYEEEFVEWGKIFCLDTKNGAVIKRVYPTENPEVVECRSINPDYPPFKVNTKSIFGWYRVLMVLSMK
jgi:SOS-response transcriptional repressor LexA